MLNFLENDDLLARVLGYLFGSLAVGAFFVLVSIFVIAGFAAFEGPP